ncbi:MAG: DUF3597 domain-containing protein [Sphingomonadaceae bacterium]|nr:DUF3597 domain-containing protein [Sphingomonadaceae bacterium]
MSILGAIKHAIFGDKGILGSGIGAAPAATNQPASTVPAQQAAAAPSASQPAGERPAMPQMASPATPAGAQSGGQPVPEAAPAQSVDVEQLLTQRAHQKGDPHLDWRHSIIDLMKLLDLDPSLKNREELAGELGYTGAKDGSAEMNIWLHRHVFEELEKSGGKVPADLKA